MPTTPTNPADYAAQQRQAHLSNIAMVGSYLMAIASGLWPIPPGVQAVALDPSGNAVTSTGAAFTPQTPTANVESPVGTELPGLIKTFTYVLTTTSHSAGGTFTDARGVFTLVAVGSNLVWVLA